MHLSRRISNDTDGRARGRRGEAWRLLMAVAAIGPALLPAQGTTAAVRSLSPPIATSPVAFKAINQLVALSDGRVLVADASARVIRLLDTSLTHPVVVLDSAAGRQTTYAAGSILMAFQGDSSLFFDAAARVFVVLDPNGSPGRVWAAPTRTSLSGSNGVPTTSPIHGLVFNSVTSPAIQNPVAGGPDVVIHIEDTVMVIRMNLTTRTRDTVARLSAGTITYGVLYPGGGSISNGNALFPFFDAALVTTDGSIAIFHAHEYRLEWIGAGDRATGVRLTYPWRSITDRDRERILDSVNAMRQHAYDSVLAKRAADSSRTGAAPTRIVYSTSDSGDRIAHTMPVPAPRRQTFATSAEVPDFYPATGRGAVLADADNHIWIHPIPSQPTPGFAVWDVIDRGGQVIDRIRIPDNHTIAGFGPGVVYLTVRDAGVVTLEKVRIWS